MTAGDDSEGRYKIGAVASATGISPETLRIWERRYGGLTPRRTSAGGRLYSDADVERLRVIKQLIDRGHGIGQLATLSVAELRGALARHDDAASVPGVRFDRLRGRFVDAIRRMDLLGAEETLTRAAAVLDTETLTTEVVAPVLKTIGDQWENGSAGVCHEHAASGIIRSVLGTLLRITPRGRHGNPVVATTLSGELHEFGALMAALQAMSAGWQVAYLGPNLPADDICNAALATRSQWLLLSVVNPVQEQAAAELTRLHEHLPRDVRLVIGGRSAAQAQPLVKRAIVLDDLGALTACLDQDGRRPSRGDSRASL